MLVNPCSCLSTMSVGVFLGCYLYLGYNSPRHSQALCWSEPRQHRWRKASVWAQQKMTPERAQQQWQVLKWVNMSQSHIRMITQLFPYDALKSAVCSCTYSTWTNSANYKMTEVAEYVLLAQASHHKNYWAPKFLPWPQVPFGFCFPF